MSSTDEADIDPHPRAAGEDKPFGTRASEKRVRRKRDPPVTREAILEAAREVLSQDGKGGLTYSQVAQRAKVNRATAYQHFHTHEKLLEATAAGVSAKLCRAIFGDPEAANDQLGEPINIESVIAKLADFAMEYPALGRVWLFQALSSRRPANDPFWREYLSRFEQVAKTESAQPGIDVEVSAVLILAGVFIWAAWASPCARDAAERKEMAGRFQREILRLCLHGTLKPEKYEDLVNGRSSLAVVHK
jgi:AcrR family transcriptional regulator